MIKKVKVLLVFFVICLLPILSEAQNPPHPNGGNAPGSGNTPVGGGAPLGGGLIVLIAMGSIYATRKSVFFKNKE